MFVTMPGYLGRAMVDDFSNDGGASPVAVPLLSPAPAPAPAPVDLYPSTGYWVTNEGGDFWFEPNPPILRYSMGYALNEGGQMSDEIERGPVAPALPDFVGPDWRVVQVDALTGSEFWSANEGGDPELMTVYIAPPSAPTQLAPYAPQAGPPIPTVATPAPAPAPVAAPSQLVPGVPPSPVVPGAPPSPVVPGAPPSPVVPGGSLVGPTQTAFIIPPDSGSANGPPAPGAPGAAGADKSWLGIAIALGALLMN